MPFVRPVTALPLGRSVQPLQAFASSLRYCHLVTGEPPSSPGVQRSVIRPLPLTPSTSVGAAGTVGVGVAVASFDGKPGPMAFTAATRNA